MQFMKLNIKYMAVIAIKNRVIVNVDVINGVNVAIVLKRSQNKCNRQNKTYP